MAKWREVPSLITENIAVSVAAEQERQRQDGCAGLEAARSSISPSASDSGLMQEQLSVRALYSGPKLVQSGFFCFVFLSLKSSILSLESAPTR